MNYNRDEVRKLEREIEETSGNRFRPYRVGGGTVNEDLVVRIAEKCEQDVFAGNGAYENMRDYAINVATLAIREALLEMAGKIEQESREIFAKDRAENWGLARAARMIREETER